MNSGDRVFHVQADEAQQTLATALRRWMPGQSWSQLQRLVRSRHVLVNGNLCVDAARRLKPQEVVKVLAQAAAPPPKEDDVRIRYVDAHLVIVEKPSGLTSNRHEEEQSWPKRRKQLQPTLDELLPRLLAKRDKPPARPKSQRQPPARDARGTRLPKIRPVHRLDRETSGLMVFARTALAQRHLEVQFRQHSIHRLYWAVVPGWLEARTIDTQLIRDRGDGRRGSDTTGRQGKRAVTHLRPLERLGDYTLLECRLETGRTHQIRIHLAEAGHPLCGDKVYRQPLHGPPIPDRSGAPRVALHAAELGLEHPVTGQWISFQMPLPKDLDQLIKRLRQQGTAHPPKA